MTPFFGFSAGMGFARSIIETLTGQEVDTPDGIRVGDNGARIGPILEPSEQQVLDTLEQSAGEVAGTILDTAGGITFSG